MTSRPRVALAARSVDAVTVDWDDPAAIACGRLHQAGHMVMIQPYLSAVDVHCETALLYLGGTYSHRIRKGSLLSGGDPETDGLLRVETISARILELAT